MKKPEFTFKTEKPTGKWKSFSNPYHYIKLKGKQVGSIDHETGAIRLMVIKANKMEDGNPNCKWKNISIKAPVTNLEGIKQYLNDNIEQILKLNLYLHP